MNKQDQAPHTSGKVGKEVFTSRRRRYDPEAWTRANQQKLQIPRFKPFELHLNAELEAKIRAAKTPMVLPLNSWDLKKPKGVAGVKVILTKNPAPRASLGYVGSAVKLESKKRFFLAVLTFPIVSKQARAIAPETSRVFRWHGHERGFEPVEPGGLANGYAWARVEDDESKSTMIEG